MKKVNVASHDYLISFGYYLS